MSIRRTLYIGPLSLFSRKVEIALREKGLDYETVVVPFTQAAGYAPKHPAVLGANPKAQVPVLVEHGAGDGGADLVLFDSTVILEYLEDAYPAPPLYPAAPAAKARCRLLELEADEVLFAPVRALLHRTEPPLADGARQAARVAEALKAEAEIARQFVLLAARLEGDFFFGDRPTAADFALFMTVLWTQRLKGPSLADTPPLAAWYGRMRARPSCAFAAEAIAAADRVLSPDLQ
jgi:glutathione S-transferase